MCVCVCVYVCKFFLSRLSILHSTIARNNVSVYVCVYIYVCKYARVCVCVCVCVYKFFCVLSKYITLYDCNFELISESNELGGKMRPCYVRYWNEVENRRVDVTSSLCFELVERQFECKSTTNTTTQ